MKYAVTKATHGAFSLVMDTRQQRVPRHLNNGIATIHMNTSRVKSTLEGEGRGIVFRGGM
jgi:hypothetical protein